MRLSLEGLVKRYGPQKALDDVSFTLKGAGIYGYLAPLPVPVSPRPSRFSPGPPQKRMRVRCALRPMEDARRPAPHPRPISGTEHNPSPARPVRAGVLCFFGGNAWAGRGKALRQRVEEVIMQVGLESHAHKLIGALFAGGIGKGWDWPRPFYTTRRSSSWMSLTSGPRSQSGHGGPRPGIQRLGKSHTVIFSSHILAEVQAIASEVLIPTSGRLVLQAPLSELNALPRARKLLPVVNGWRSGRCGGTFYRRRQ